MKNLYQYIIAALLIGFTQSSFSQNTYFFNQKNIFSVHASFNPRLIPMGQNNLDNTNIGEHIGVGRGTYYIYYDENNKLVGEHQKTNLMLNFNYGRLLGGENLIGVEFNYQKHHFTMNKNANNGYQEDDYSSGLIPYEISTPVFNTYDIQFQYGRFTSANLAPSKHLWTYGLGIRLISLDQKQNYRSDSETQFTDLNDFMEDYDKPFVFVRFSTNYTYRILITKNLSFDLGVNFNIGLAAMHAEVVDGIPSTHDYSLNNSAYQRSFIKAKLSHETLYNIFYFRSGLSFAL